MRLTQPPLQPFTDPSFYLLVRNEAAMFDIAVGFTHRSQKRNFIRCVAKIDVVWKPIDSLEHLFFNAHG